jgi:nucleoside-diphosphate-sugar epimerase
MKILLTGATGFIGSAFLEFALRRNFQVAALARPGKLQPHERFQRPNLLWIEGTLADAPWKQIAAFQPEVCVHAAWITTPEIYLESPENWRYLQWSVDFLKHAINFGVKRFLVLGTCIEYQIGEEILSEEQTPLSPNTLYAQCKNSLHKTLREDLMFRELSLCWGRIFYPYGVGEYPTRLCSSLIRRLKENQKVFLKTPDSIKDYIHIEDLATALLKIIESNFSGAINLGTGVGVSIREIAGLIAGLMNKPDLIEENVSAAPDSYNRVIADATKLHSIGWQPTVSLRTGLTEMVDQLT